MYLELASVFVNVNCPQFSLKVAKRLGTDLNVTVVGLSLLSLLYLLYLVS
jgi:hypothetical protein